ncbi:glycosyltransferase family 2 protein [Bacteroidota bacterium]
MDISIVIPLFNEEESLPELYKWIVKVTNDNKLSYEIIFINDGSTDNSWSVIEELSKKDKQVKGIKFRRNYGKSPALHCGFQKASGDVVVTMDADLQDSPEEIPELYKMIKEDGYDLVSGWKKKRHDPLLSKNLPSKLANATARMMTGVKLHDINCGLKAYKNKVIKNIEIYGDMHRYIPILANQAGFTNIGEKVVTHQKRKYGKTKFGLNRFINGYLDLLTLVFVGRFSKRPMHFFGTLGTFMFFLGGFISIYIVAQKLYRMHLHLKVRDAVDQPLFFIALVIAIIGVQLFLTGFIAEILSRQSVERNKYQIEKEIN